jgi:hypothetical protein
LHCRACMQPKANIKPRAEFTKSAPMDKAHATDDGVINLPDAMTLICCLKSDLTH